MLNPNRNDLIFTFIITRVEKEFQNIIYYLQTKVVIRLCTINRSLSNGLTYINLFVYSGRLRLHLYTETKGRIFGGGCWERDTSLYADHHRPSTDATAECNQQNFNALLIHFFYCSHDHLARMARFLLRSEVEIHIRQTTALGTSKRSQNVVLYGVSFWYWFIFSKYNFKDDCLYVIVETFNECG